MSFINNAKQKLKFSKFIYKLHYLIVAKYNYIESFKHFFITKFKNVLYIKAWLGLIVVGFITERSENLFISKSQCSVKVGGQTIKEHNLDSFNEFLYISFYSTTKVYNVFPNPISSQRAPDKLFFTKNPIHWTPSIN